MMTVKKNSGTTKPKTVSEDTQVKYAIDFIEELSWILESKKNLKLSKIPEILRQRLIGNSSLENSNEQYKSPNPNIHYLIGILPRLFQDTKIFASNDDIAQFSKEVLNVTINRVDKRSRYELIGLIVCETNKLNDKVLEDLVNSLAIITQSNEKVSLMASEKSTIGFSWNETIRKLAND